MGSSRAGAGRLAGFPKVARGYRETPELAPAGPLSRRGVEAEGGSLEGGRSGCHRDAFLLGFVWDVQFTSMYT